MTTYNSRYSAHIAQTFAPEDDALRSVAERLARRGQPTYSIEPEEGRFLQCLTAMCNTRRAVEFGTLGGYSGVWIARGLSAGGRLITVELEPQRAQVARETFEQAGVADRIDLMEGDALAMLDDIATYGPFDLAFVDTSIHTYDRMLDWALANVRPGGIVALHNAFQYGGLLSQAPQASSNSMYAFHQRFANEPRLMGTIFPAGDGILFGVVRAFE